MCNCSFKNVYNYVIRMEEEFDERHYTMHDKLKSSQKFII